MGIGKGLALAGAALLGAAVAVLPAVASSETATPIAAENGPGVYEHHWKPAEETVGEGATLTIDNSTEVRHGVEWKSGPETPACSAGVPVGNSFAASGTKWTGTCTFKKVGTYVFWCTVHSEAMKAVVIVTPASTTTGTTGTTSPGGTTGTVPGGGGGGGTNAPPPVSPLASPPTASAAITAVKIRSQQRGRAVSGSLNVSGAGAGGRLEVDLLAKRASLASARSSFLRVGRTMRSTVGSGPVRFTVPLSASGRRALARAGRLVLLVEITLTPRSGRALVVKRSVSLRA